MPVFEKPFKQPAAEHLDQLTEFLTECYLDFLNHRRSRVICIPFAVETFNPLGVLQFFQAIDPHHFYFERGEQAVLALGKAIQLTVESRDRFAQTRDLIADLSAQIVTPSMMAGHTSDIHSRFFCNFSFFAASQTSTTSPANITSQATILLPRWQLQQSDPLAKSWAIAHVVLHPEFAPAVESQRLWDELAHIRSQPQPSLQAVSNSITPADSRQNDDRFKQSVTQALHSIADSQLDKIVLAKTLDITASQPFDLIQSLQNLGDRYPNCYRFSASCGNGETFIGASPERLVAVHDRQLQTEALAGSAPRGTTPEADAQFAKALLQSEKESHEHQLVIDFITQRLAGLNIRTQLGAPHLLQLPNIQHRHTPIQGTLPESGHILDVVGSLHPTPAVAGLPREIACQRIPQYEDFDRGWYAAPIGWVDTQGNGEFAVGIRSAVLSGDRARLYAGAGIVAGSVPEKELNEVQMKLQALLEALV
jgi:menaquinone-specific isochorismate synthase